MKLKEYKKEDLELMGYDDIAVIILEEAGKKMKIGDIFKKICKALDMSDSEFEAQIGDFFELLSTNKNFIMLKNGFWDLRTKHTPKIVIDDDEDEMIETTDDDILEEKEETEEDIFYDTDGDDDEEEDDLEDLVVIDVDEEEEANII